MAMFVAVVRDAWRQYRRRPLAAAVAVAVGGLAVFLRPDDQLVAVPLAVGKPVGQPRGWRGGVTADTVGDHLVQSAAPPHARAGWPAGGSRL
jgi:hypothetical protein